MLQDLTRRARGIQAGQITVSRMFFSCSPVWNRELYDAIQQQMLRDYSPTYWFRVMRAEQLLAMYRRDPAEFANLAQEYKSQFVTNNRAPHRLSVWLKREDLVYHNDNDLRADPGKKLVRALDRPDYFGYNLKIAADYPDNLEYFRAAAPAALDCHARHLFALSRARGSDHARRGYLHEFSRFLPRPRPATSFPEPDGA